MEDTNNPRRATVGRIVHYTSYGTPKGEYKPECRAGIVTQLHDDNNFVGIFIANPTGIFFNEKVKYDNARNGGTWHWPLNGEGKPNC